MNGSGMELGKSQGEILHPGFQVAYEQFDRETIEREAHALVDGHSEFMSKSAEMYHDNARTSIWEGLTASGHLSRIEIRGSLEEINAQVLKRLLNGLRDDLPAHEYQRRFAELCNELIIQRLHRGIAAGAVDPTTAVHELSDFPTLMLNSEKQGYRGKNVQGMSRSTTLAAHDDGTYTRIIEQISRSSSTDGSTGSFLKAAGARVEQRATPDIDTLNTPLVYSTAEYDGAVEIQRLLDSHASQIAGEPVRYGDRLSDVPDSIPYDKLREESRARENMVAFYEPVLAEFERSLDAAFDAGFINNEQRIGQYGLQLVNVLRAICGRAPQFAKACFGERAAEYYEAASNLHAQGRTVEARQMIDSARAVEEPVVVCGILIPAELATQLGLQATSVEKLLELGQENWTITKGICRIKNCPSPKPTEIGPCQVCMLNCQPKFDKGGEPVYANKHESLSDMAERMFKPFVLRGVGELATKADGPKSKEFAFSH
ncbi:MAG TPA: hypothetical protein VLI54_07360 [Bacillota bacterium]|nr:hypothetical protein [Bacillota bacterium]